MGSKTTGLRRPNYPQLEQIIYNTILPAMPATAGRTMSQADTLVPGATFPLKRRWRARSVSTWKEAARSLQSTAEAWTDGRSHITFAREYLSLFRLTRYDAARAKRGEMLTTEDVIEILSIPLVGIVP